MGRTDPIAVEHLRQTTESAGYALIVERIKQMAERKLRDLRGDLGHSASCRVRGYLDALEDVLRVPQIITEEARKHQQ